jgi:hypothetical protein
MNPERLPHPHQVVLAIEALISFPLQSGLFIADVMGTGKTTSVIVIFVLLRQIAMMYADFEAARADGDTSQHLMEGMAQNPGSPVDCPSTVKGTSRAYRYHLTCPCVPGSFLDKYQIRPRLGVFLSVVPQSIITVWMKEWSQSLCPVTADRLGLKLVVAHSAANQSKYEYALLSKKDKQDMRANVDTVEEPSEMNGYQGRYNITGKLQNTRFLVVSTSQSVKRRFTDNFDYKYAKTLYHGKRRVPRTTHYYQCTGVQFGVIVCDESHKGYKSTSPMINFLQTQVVKQSAPCLLPMSATPFEFGPYDIAEYIRIMERSHQSRGGFSTERLRHCTFKEIERLHKDFESVRDSRKMAESERATKLDNVVKQMTHICNTVMIRRTQETDFFGEKIVQIPPNLFIEVPVKMPVDQSLYAELKQYEAETNQEFNKQWRKVVIEARRLGRREPKSYGSGAAIFHRWRQMVSIPYLCTMSNAAKKKAMIELHERQTAAPRTTESGQEEEYSLKSMPSYLDLTQRQALDRGWYRDPKSSPFSPMIGDLTSSSAKLQWLKQTWLRLKDDKDIEGFPAQWIVSSCFATPTIIIYLVSPIFNITSHY